MNAKYLKVWFVLMWGLLSIGCNKHEEHIDANEVKRLLDEGRLVNTIICDVRTKEEYEAGHIAGSFSIPLSTLKDREKEIDKEKNIIVYCKSGCNRSVRACQILKSLGFKKVINMKGGIDEWIKIGGKIEGNYEPGKTCPVPWEIGHGCED